MSPHLLPVIEATEALVPLVNKLSMKIFILIILVAACCSCRSTKKIQTAITKKDTVEAPVATNKVDTAALIKNTLDKLNVNRLDYQTFTAKLDIDYRGGDSKHY